MASIRQFQRRAIEVLAAHLKRPVNALESIYALRSIHSLNFRLYHSIGTPLKILGISDGVGTCSDIKGMNVLVLSADERSRPQVETLEKVRTCAYAVLLRPATRKEMESANYDPVLSVFCVELLRVTDIAMNYTDMEPIDPGVYYVATI